jgi:hypothetical protein
VLRFIRDLKSEPCDRKVGPLSAQECCDATRKAIYLAQRAEYAAEIHCLKNGLPIPRSSKLKDLHHFLDSCDFLRVGGRLINTDDEKHQLIIPANHRLVDLVIKHEHEKLLRAGNQLVISSLRSRYWITTGSVVVKNVLCEISSSHGGKYEVQNCLLGCTAV